jgi:hypothetical protein
MANEVLRLGPNQTLRVIRETPRGRLSSSFPMRKGELGPDAQG